MERALAFLIEMPTSHLWQCLITGSLVRDYSRKVKVFPIINPPVESWIVFAPLPGQAEWTCSVQMDVCSQAVSVCFQSSPQHGTVVASNPYHSPEE